MIWFRLLVCVAKRWLMINFNKCKLKLVKETSFQNQVWSLGVRIERWGVTMLLLSCKRLRGRMKKLWHRMNGSITDWWLSKSTRHLKIQITTRFNSQSFSLSSYPIQSRKHKYKLYQLDNQLNSVLSQMSN